MTNALRRILRLRQVVEATGRKPSTIYEGIQDGTFPAPVPLGARSVGWLEDEIIDWQERAIAERERRIAADPPVPAAIVPRKAIARPATKPPPERPRRTAERARNNNTRQQRRKR